MYCYMVVSKVFCYVAPKAVVYKSLFFQCHAYTTTYTANHLVTGGFLIDDRTGIGTGYYFLYLYLSGYGMHMHFGKVHREGIHRILLAFLTRLSAFNHINTLFTCVF